jgi:hypothetical protein
MGLGHDGHGKSGSEKCAVNGPPQILMDFSPESKYSDVCAILDSYAVELNVLGRTQFRADLHCCGLDEGQGWSNDSTADIDTTLELRMIRYQPSPEMCFREIATRWPFYVEAPLNIRFRFGDQWWVYGFTPGKAYGNREMVPQSAVDELERLYALESDERTMHLDPQTSSIQNPKRKTRPNPKEKP